MPDLTECMRVCVRACTCAILAQQGIVQEKGCIFCFAGAHTPGQLIGPSSSAIVPSSARLGTSAPQISQAAQIVGQCLQPIAHKIQGCEAGQVAKGVRDCPNLVVTQIQGLEVCHASKLVWYANNCVARQLQLLCIHVHWIMVLSCSACASD